MGTVQSNFPQEKLLAESFIREANIFETPIGSFKVSNRPETEADQVNEVDWSGFADYETGDMEEEKQADTVSNLGGTPTNFSNPNFSVGSVGTPASNPSNILFQSPATQPQSQGRQLRFDLSNTLDPSQFPPLTPLQQNQVQQPQSTTVQQQQQLNPVQPQQVQQPQQTFRPQQQQLDSQQQQGQMDPMNMQPPPQANLTLEQQINQQRQQQQNQQNQVPLVNQQNQVLPVNQQNQVLPNNTVQNNPPPGRAQGNVNQQQQQQQFVNQQNQPPPLVQQQVQQPPGQQQPGVQQQQAAPFTQADIQRIVASLNTLNIVDILKATQIDIGNLSDQNLVKLLTCAVHCICNGPVGVNKSTKFPGANQEYSIKSIVDCTNRTWRNFCEYLITNRFFTPPQNCYMFMSYGSAWPACEAQHKAAVERRGNN